MTVADRIREKRKELNLTQGDLAKKIGYSDKTSVSKVENSGNEISMKKIKRFADAMGTSAEYLLGWDQIDHAKQSFGFYDFLEKCGLSVSEDIGMYYSDEYPGRDWIIRDNHSKEEFSLSIKEMDRLEQLVKNCILNFLTAQESTIEGTDMRDIISPEATQIAIAYDQADDVDKAMVERILRIDFKKENARLESSGLKRSFDESERKAI